METILSIGCTAQVHEQSQCSFNADIERKQSTSAKLSAILFSLCETQKEVECDECKHDPMGPVQIMR